MDILIDAAQITNYPQMCCESRPCAVQIVSGRNKVFVGYKHKVGQLSSLRSVSTLFQSFHKGMALSADLG